MNNEYTRVFKALSDAKRIRILELLCENEECACILMNDLKISQPTLSHHMKILCDSGIVSARKEGKWTYYRINEDGCTYASELLNNLKNHHMDKVVTILRQISKAIHPGGIVQKNETGLSETGLTYENYQENTKHLS